MGKYIDKDELEAFLNELRENLGDSDYDRGYLCAIDSIFGCYLNSTEVKEVDLEKEIKEYWLFADKTEVDCLESMCLTEDIFVSLAKKFFELGLKAQKGE